ncbi:putative chromosome segregation protein [Neofusicoccum parvum UCRNP2]|uniref:Putative chromosome segregation protein n=1 Tax=Botryosphaeria parva (strain UCR-NP2) TaxID=1287680 RepID=R1H1A0_BOTPV|nr:putative chromosome segregation protein [Neofusicoccum parvum UCRNP2]
MAGNTQAIAQLLQQSLDPRHSKEAEGAIKQQEESPGLAIALLQIVADASIPQTTRLAAALYFKNFIRRRWTDVEGNYKLQQNEVVTVKQELIGLMISQPPSIQSQLGEAISTIAESDFYERWETLVDDLVSRLTPDNPIANNGVLQVAHSIFKRWRPLFRSDDLFTEINFVLGKFADPFLQLFQNTDAQITANVGNKEVLQNYIASLNLILKLFVDLSCQDMPPQFDDNLKGLSELLHKYLVFDSPALHTDDESEAGLLEFTKAGIFEVLILYTQKYEDEFGQYLQPFIESSWNLLTNIGPETKYDILVSKALQFLTSVTSNNTHAQLFNNEATLNQVVEKVILPNLTLRESDVEMFEDEPIEFIRRDLEGSDSDTRRRAATDFLRQLETQFEGLVTAVVNKYIDNYLQHYAQDRANNWKSKDTAVYLFSSIAAKGTPTAAFGVKTVNPHVNILDFFQKNIAEDLTGENVEPILKVDAIKFVYLFRSQLTQQYWQAAFPLLVRHLGVSNFVIYSYAAIAVERALYLVDDNRQPVISRDSVAPLAKDLLMHLFGLIQKESAPEKIQENEFLMKCVMRVLIVIKDGVLPIADAVLKNFINITMVIRHNPSNPRFYYYHFEGIGALIKGAAPSQPQKLEQALYDPFSTILRSEVEEFTPYVFQLFAALLEANPAGVLPDYYKSLIPPLLMPVVWENKGNIPALVRLLSVMISRDPGSIVQNSQLEPLLGIFQKLVSTKTNESHGFDLLEAIVASVPVDSLKPYFTPMLTIMLTRLSNSKTENFASRFVRFYHFVAARDDKGLGSDFFISVADSVQQDVFRPIYPQIILPDTQKLTRPFDRKTAVVSLTKTLADGQAFIERYKKGWTLTCEALLKLLINPPTAPATDDIMPEADVDDLSFGAGFTQLNSCRKAPQDPFPEMVDVKRWVGEYLKQADQRNGGRISQFVQERLSEEAKTALIQTMQG